MLKSTKQKPKQPFVCTELSKLPMVRDMQPIEAKSPEYQFEMTDGKGFEKTRYKVYILREKSTGYPVLSTVINNAGDLFSSQFIKDRCFSYGLSAQINNDKAVLSMKLKHQGGNVQTFLKFYDFLTGLKMLVDFRETIQDVQHNREEV